MKLLKPVILDPVQGGNGSLRTTLYFLSHFRLEKQAFIQASTDSQGSEDRYGIVYFLSTEA